MHVPIKFHVKNNCFLIKCFLKTTKVTRLASQTHWVHLLRAKIIFFHSSVLKRVPLLERSGILLPCLLTTSGASDIWPHSAACSSSSRKEKCFYVEMIHKINSFRQVSFSSLVSFFDFTQLTQFSCPVLPEWKALLASGDWKYHVILKTHIILKELFQRASKWKMPPFQWHGMAYLYLASHRNRRTLW